MDKVLFRGIIPPVVTVFTEAGVFDRQGMARMIDHLVNSKVNGLFFLGGAGEFCHMTHAMRTEIAEFCVSYTNHRLPVLIGISSPGTLETIEYGQHAKSIGADGVVVVNPYYATLSDESLYQHYKKIAENVDLPILMYNFPALTGQDLKPALVKRLAQDCKNIVGIKETVDCMSHIREMIHTVKAVRPEFVVFAGYDEYLLSTLIIGGDGSIPATANFVPEIMCGIYEAFQTKDFDKLVELQNALSFIPALYGMDAPFFAGVKEAIKMCGVDISTHVLPPALPFSEDNKQQLKKMLTQCGALKA